ncbi:hypothetical protein CRG98_034038 [Punica granatum]|uniref:Uncharacterized protein n=1 Tax=Punica granatum TaxID=22663 RepID=A0A2I0IP92_PUNGR|nr:hypothetical protein CRG98_034038 [Punica granatum]
MDPLPNVNRAHSMAAHDEAQSLIAQGRDSSFEVMGFVAKIATDSVGGNPNFIGDFKPRGQPFCDYCNPNGHHWATCYQLHGYPSSEQSNRRNSKGNSSVQSRPGGSRGQSASSIALQQREV